MDYMKFARFFGSLLVCGVIFSLVLSWPAGSRENEACVAIIESKCKDCHSITRICRNLTKTRNKIWWKSNIENMVAYGAEYTDKEQDVFLKCLIKPYADIQGLCK